MGYDLYGLNPNNPNNAVKPEHFDWNDKTITSENKDEYYEAIAKYESEVVGSYFRNNVWWWRPLWTFVVSICDDILNADDINGGHENGGHKISKTKSKRIAARIRKMDKTKVLEGYEKQIKGIVDKATEHNKKVQLEMDAINEACHKEHGNDIVPMNYPEPYKKKWNDAYAKQDWAGYYPFDADNAREFAKFCDNSGGFEIC